MAVGKSEIITPPSNTSEPPSEPPASEPSFGRPASSNPSATSTTVHHNSPSTSSSSSSSTSTAIRRMGQIGQHLKNIPSTLAYEMSQTQFKQAPHKLLVIPGPIEVTDEVLAANAHPSMSHVSPDFVPILGDCIRMFRDTLVAPEAQPVITAGSGSLGWDHVASNVIEPGEEALVLNSGYFGDSFAECLEVYGAKVTQIKAPIGSKPSLQEVEAELQKKKYKVLTFTHVDTSTGVLSDAKGLGELVKRVSPETILVLDGVCSVGSEEIQMDAWGIDVVLTASQKGLSCPPGLMLLAASKKAIAAFENRKSRPNSYFASWAKWLPVMKAYESGTGAYFATPPVQLLYALHASLTNITKGPVSLQDRWAKHVETSNRIKQFVKDLGLSQLVTDSDKDGAHGMTTVKYPQGFKAPDILPKLVAKNVVVAAGLHKEVKDTYMRFGHMGTSSVLDNPDQIDYLLKSVKEVLEEAGYKK
ncbi:unnamed protein product [Sympodiomycopsis kandeliae]